MPFVVFEGGEGVGKSTQVQLTRTFLQSKGMTVVCTQEPGGTPLANEIRHLFKKCQEDEPLAKTEFFLVMAARWQHLEKIVRPALAKGHWVLCDRFMDSTYIYQGLLRGLDLHWMNMVSNEVICGLLPDVTFIIDLPVAVSKLRSTRQAGMDRLDDMQDEQQQVLQKGFANVLLSPYPCGNVPLRILVDGGQSVPEVSSVIQAHLSKIETHAH